MLAPDQVHIPDKAFGQYFVIEGGQKHQQSTAPQAQTNEGAYFIVVRSNGLRLESIQGVPAGAVMSLAIFGPDEVVHLVGKGD